MRYFPSATDYLIISDDINRKQNTKGWIRLSVSKNMVEKIEYYYLLLRHCYHNPYKVYLEIRKRIKI